MTLHPPGTLGEQWIADQLQKANNQAPRRPVFTSAVDRPVDPAAFEELGHRLAAAETAEASRRWARAMIAPSILGMVVIAAIVAL